MPIHLGNEMDLNSTDNIWSADCEQGHQIKRKVASSAGEQSVVHTNYVQRMTVVCNREFQVWKLTLIYSILIDAIESKKPDQH